MSGCRFMSECSQLKLLVFQLEGHVPTTECSAWTWTVYSSPGPTCCIAGTPRTFRVPRGSPQTTSGRRLGWPMTRLLSRRGSTSTAFLTCVCRSRLSPSVSCDCLHEGGLHILVLRETPEQARASSSPSAHGWTCSSLSQEDRHEHVTNADWWRGCAMLLVLEPQVLELGAHVLEPRVPGSLSNSLRAKGYSVKIVLRFVNLPEVRNSEFC